MGFDQHPTELTGDRVWLLDAAGKPSCGMKIKFHPIDGQMPPFRRHLVHIHEQSIILVSG